MRTKYIFVVGGVISGVGKGTTVSSLALLLQSRGYRVTGVKIDPYVNLDAGTMNPTEHGEVFVTRDGMECDQDLGNYERFLDTEVSKDNYMTTGQVYLSVIQRERNLGYHGEDVEVVPHIPEEVIRRIKLAVAKNKAEICIVEIGGTVGEYQNLLFLEAARMMHLQHPQDVIFILVSYVPIPPTIGEMKTKPTQSAARALNTAGIQANFVVCRAENPLDERRKQRVSIFCNVNRDDVVSAPDVDFVYEAPLNLEKDHLSDKVLGKLGLRPRRRDLRKWRKLVSSIRNARREVKIAIVGKYFGAGDYILSDSYISVIESIKHACFAQKVKPNIAWVNSEEFEKRPKAVKKLAAFDGIIVPGGFGGRGIEGKIAAIRYAREKKIPYFGLCYGMQLATIEFARNVCHMKKAHTTEVNRKTPYPVIDILPEQKKNLKEKNFGATMRLGNYKCKLVKGTKAYEAYRRNRNKLFPEPDRFIVERHRHRYELNNDFRKKLESKGLLVSGVNHERNLVEIVELKKHPWFVGTQFHPEFKSHPLSPHPLYLDFIRACIKK
jgi:CTP synthase